MKVCIIVALLFLAQQAPHHGFEGGHGVRSDFLTGLKYMQKYQSIYRMFSQGPCAALNLVIEEGNVNQQVNVC